MAARWLAEPQLLRIASGGCRRSGALGQRHPVVDRHSRDGCGNRAGKGRGVEIDDAAGGAAAAADVAPEALAPDAVWGYDADAGDRDARTPVSGHSAYNTHPHGRDSAC